MPIRSASAARLVSLMVAVTTPVVSATMEFACRTVALPSVTSTATLAAVSMESEAMASAMAAAVPVNVSMAVASMVPPPSPALKKACS